MDARGALADEQRLGDAPVRVALGEQDEDLALTRRQPERIGGPGGRSVRPLGDDLAGRRQVDAEPSAKPVDVARQQDRADAGGDRG